MTQVEAAALFGVSQPRVSNLLKGRIDKFTGYAGELVE